MTDTDAQGRITTELDDHLLWIGIDRTAKRNAFSVTMLSELSRAYGELERNDDARCGILFGYGDHFTAGLDLAEVAPRVSEAFSYPAEGIDPLGITGPPRTKPLIAVAQGWCLTLGIELLLAADVRIASGDTRFAQIEIKRGIYPFGGATIRLPREAGWANAMRWLLTGDEFSAQTAQELGLVQEVTETGQQLATAEAIARSIAAQAPLGVRATLASARRALTEGEESAAHRLLPDALALFDTEDAKEGLRSFVERREASFVGR
jgi:enoyl-CoA hydratase/carnithine racemase